MGIYNEIYHNQALPASGWVRYNASIPALNVAGLQTVRSHFKSNVMNVCCVVLCGINYGAWTVCGADVVG
jgi:hypothetical protein